MARVDLHVPRERVEDEREREPRHLPRRARAGLLARRGARERALGRDGGRGLEVEREEHEREGAARDKVELDVERLWEDSHPTDKQAQRAASLRIGLCEIEQSPDDLPSREGA